MLWYYTPMAIGAEPATCLASLRVYDAMDDLASFLNAPPELLSNQARLIALADVVFTGGPTLYRSLRDRHHSVHCFPSGVEPTHFAQSDARPPHPALAGAARPILGYYGVIDERLDLALLADIADMRPDWTVALVGPVAKINPDSIPVRDNVVRVGQREYHELPAILSAFDVALMPFARNEATRSISPTKTLEYLAGGKPVISTPITDVIDLYADVVEIADTSEGFVAAAERLLETPGVETRHWNYRAARIVAANGWDVIAMRMLDLMARARVRPLVIPALEPAALTA
jgi:glycosyltransferase involved in cell wall biosynthesis